MNTQPLLTKKQSYIETYRCPQCGTKRFTDRYGMNASAGTIHCREYVHGEEASIFKCKCLNCGYEWRTQAFIREETFFGNKANSMSIVTEGSD